MLLGDNTPTHTVGDAEVVEDHGFKVIRLSNAKRIFLPANTTSVIQPLDQGIMASRKAHYRRIMVRWLLSEAEKADNQGKSLKNPRPTFYQMVRWVHEAWAQCIVPSVIRNCWHKAGILPNGWVAAPPDTRAKRAAIAARELAGDTAAPHLADTIDIATSEDSAAGSSTNSAKQ